MKFSRTWLWLLLLIPLAVGIVRLHFDVEILNLLPTNLSVVQGLKLYQQHFSSARELIIALEGGNPEQTESDARSLAQVLRNEPNLVTDVIWQPPWMEDPAQMMEMLSLIWLNQTPPAFGELTNRLAVANLSNTLQETRERLATSLSPNDLGMGGYDPYGLTRLPESGAAGIPVLGSGEEMFASANKTFRLVYVEARPELADYRDCRSWMENIRGIVAQARNSGMLSSQAKVHYTGRPAFVAEISLAMQQDMGGASAGTLAIIGMLFWLTHRRILPLTFLLVLLVAILAGTLALGGLLIGTINVVSMGFASILLGLAEDFGIVIYEESRSHPELSASELRHEAAPGIWWSTLTTAGAFLILNLSGLPGLGQLGSMVAIGIILGALVMLYGYVPLVLRFRSSDDRQPSPSKSPERLLLFQTSKLLPSRLIWTITAFVLVASSGLLCKNGLRFDNSPDPLRPKNSEAYATLEKIKTQLTRSEDPLWVLVPGQNASEVGRRLEKVGACLNQSLSNGWIAGFTLPSILWPKPENQQSNRPAVAAILQNRDAFRVAAITAGFTTNAFFVTDNILNCWERVLASKTDLWPTNRASRWLFSKFAARTSNGFMALGLVEPTINATATKSLAANCPSYLQHEGVFLSGYNLLGWTVFDLVWRELPWVVIPVFVLVLVSLWLAFRNLREVFLSLATLVFSALCLVAIMHLLKWDWNLLNLMALPLLLGMGVDFSIHIQLALRRYKGDLLVVRRSVGRALLLAGSTTVAGFGSLAFSSNVGMASLGLVCALGITLALVTAVYLLPVWWTSLNTIQKAWGDEKQSASVKAN